MDTNAFARSVEAEFGFTCPLTFLSFYADFLAFADTSKFSQKFGEAHVIRDVTEVVDLHDQCCPRWIVPFLWVQNFTSRDYYGFDTSQKIETEWPVCVFAVHAVVNSWPDFESFLNWAKS